MDDSNGTKYPTWKALGIIVTVLLFSLGGVTWLARSAYSTSQDNRVELSGIQATLQSFDKTIIRFDETLIRIEERLP